MTEPSPVESLTALRMEIDRIDAAMHALLIERGEIIDELIAVKARQGGGSAFRPGREAAMMRHLAERHRGALPLDTVEGIWRIIISTFTYIQAPYAVHADASAGEAAMRDAARFHFGFTVPLETHGSPEAVIGAVAAADGVLGLLPAGGGATGAPWWWHLGRDGAPMVIARLPFVERVDHPAGLPLFVIARPGAAAPDRDVVLHAVAFPPSDSEDEPSLDLPGATLVDQGGDGSRSLRLYAVPGAEAEGFANRVAEQSPGAETREVGSHAARFMLADTPSPSR